MPTDKERWDEAQKSVPANLEKLAQMVDTRIKAGPTMAKAIPTKGCPVCGTLYDKQVLRTRPDPRLWLCHDCMQHMANGETAFICVDKRFVFAVIKSGTKDLQNMVVQDVSLDDFATLLARTNGNAPSKA